MSTANEIQHENAEKQKKRKFGHVSNMNSDVNNPCVKEQQLSYKCLSDNNYDRDTCQLYFMNYQNCRDFWYQVSTERRKQGIRPYLPPPEDRNAVKEGYLKANSLR